eukprot:3882556-Pyramimonas_sp.AAC.1
MQKDSDQTSVLGNHRGEYIVPCGKKHETPTRAPEPIRSFVSHRKMDPLSLAFPERPRLPKGGP